MFGFAKCWIYIVRKGLKESVSSHLSFCDRYLVLSPVSRFPYMGVLYKKGVLLIFVRFMVFSLFDLFPMSFCIECSVHRVV